MPATATHSPEQRAARLAAAPAAISIEAVDKSFRLPRQRFTTLKERALHPFQAQEVDVLRALDQINFEVREGEFFGIVGRNGSGKSTLLKCLAGIYDIDSGRIGVSGRLSPFIELGVGFSPGLTARDNVMINAVMLGLSRRQARERFDEIIDFAGLEEFVDLKLNNFSSGMLVRLAFSVAIQVDADILLIDEVLAVGDAAFQAKCFDQFDRLKDAGRTIVFVSHDMSAIERFCDRALVLERGRIVGIGDPHEMALRYIELNFGATVHAASEDGEPGRAPVSIVSAWFEDGSGEHVIALEQGERCSACFEVEVHEPLEDPVFGVALRNDHLATILAASSEWERGATGRFEPGERVLVRIGFDNWLAPSRYTLTPSVGLAGSTTALDLRADLASLTVSAPKRSGGVADLPLDFEIIRS